MSGGNREAFEEVQLAYEVLSDPVARQRYDETGDTGRGPKAPTLRETALLHLSELVAEAVANNPDDARHVDIVAALEDSVVDGKNQASRQCEKLRHAARVLKVVAENMRNVAGKPNDFSAALLSRVGELEAKAAREEKVLALAEEELRLLEEYRYDYAPDIGSPVAVNNVLSRLFDELNRKEAK